MTIKTYQSLATAIALALSMTGHAAPPAPAAPTQPVVAAVPAAPAAPAPPSVDAIRQYEESLRSAEAEQRAALEAVEAARTELETRARARAIQAEEARETAEVARAHEHEELREVQRELQRAHENLRRASREVARVHREINRPAPRVVEYRFSSDDTDRAVIGVILGGNTDNGVKVLGVSPDGPAERAGLAPGDVIIAVMDQPLAGGETSPQRVLTESVKGIEVGDEIAVTVLRDGEERQFDLVASKREPLTWHSWSELRTAPIDGETAQVLVERIEAPHVDSEAMEAQMRVLRERFSDGEWDFEFDEFSDFGDAVISGTNIWFGMPLTRGLKMTGLEPGLGRYFDSDRGVLVLEAMEDNGLQLQPGDVILRVGDSQVERPSDVMRALREVESGKPLAIAIKRDRREQTLEITLPEKESVSFWRLD